MRRPRARWPWIGLLLLGMMLAGGAVLPLLAAYPSTERSFDRGTNGLWIGHRFYSGRDVRSGEAVAPTDVDALVETLETRGIRYAYVHAGPLLDDGSVADAPGAAFARLRATAPEHSVLLAWIGARVEKVALESGAWRAGVLETIAALERAGFAGVHFDLEPLRDGHPGYLALLAEVRERFGERLRVSQATPRSGIFGLAPGPLGRNFWSAGFYRETMALTDQTVVMAYDTKLGWTRGYVAFVGHQTRLLTRWACARPGHELLIGIPAHEDVPTYSDPEVENIKSAVLGVRAALEDLGPEPECFRGVAVYANWVTDADEWADYERYWVSPGRR